MEARVLCFFFLTISVSVFAQVEFEIPIGQAFGYSVFSSNLSHVGIPESDSRIFNERFVGIPKRLKNIKRHLIVLDHSQYYYQQFSENKISKEEYGHWKKAFGFESYDVEGQLLVNNVTFAVTGEDKSGNLFWVVDSNFDLDFSDEEVRRWLPSAAVQIMVRKVKDGKVSDHVIPVAIYRTISGEGLRYNFPRHYLATITLNNRAYNLAFETSQFLEQNQNTIK